MIVGLPLSTRNPQLFNFLIKFGLSRETPVTTSLGTQIGPASGAWGRRLNHHSQIGGTVDGRNPAPDMDHIPFFIGFDGEQVVQDFFHVLKPTAS